MKDTVEDLVALQAIVRRLEDRFPGRRFTLDGHLVGSIGEVWAAYRFGLKLLKASAKTHDAVAPDGRHVQVKATGGKSISISSRPQHLIVLRLERDGGATTIYNGPGRKPWMAAGKKQKNGQRSLSLAKLRALQEKVAPEDAVPHVEPAE